VHLAGPTPWDLALQADFAVELGRDDETLELPWAAPESGPRYYDLKRQPEMLAHIAEALSFGELADFLVVVNSSASVLQSAKCDAWGSREMNPEEEIFGAEWKIGSYVDLLFSNKDARHSFTAHEDFIKQLTALLKQAPDIPASAEFLLRRCFYHEEDSDGFYLTFYLFGYGSDEAKARQQWGIALRLSGNAIVQCSSRLM
jgi:hypothetical protein